MDFDFGEFGEFDWGDINWVGFAVLTIVAFIFVALALRKSSLVIKILGFALAPVLAFIVTKWKLSGD